MNKAYTRINWENEPSDATPLNETNLNRMDAAINEIDTRVVTMDTTKLSVTTANTMVKDVAFNETTGVFTITKLNGSVVTINTALEKIATNFVYNKTTQKLILTLIDGTTQEVDLTALLTQYEFLDSDTIAFTISSDGKVTASVKNGSITGDKLEPNYLADVTLQANNAKDSADNAKTSEELAYQYAEEARESASQAQVNNAANITYDNSISGLSATNVKDALDEVAQGSDSAVKDGDGNVITETYAKQTDLEKVIDGTTTVAKATQDADGNNIVNTYAKKSSVLSTVSECEASTNDTDIAGASALAELNDSLKTKVLFDKGNNGANYFYENTYTSMIVPYSTTWNYEGITPTWYFVIIIHFSGVNTMQYWLELTGSSIYTRRTDNSGATWTVTKLH